MCRRHRLPFRRYPPAARSALGRLGGPRAAAWLARTPPTPPRPRLWRAVKSAGPRFALGPNGLRAVRPSPLPPRRRKDRSRPQPFATTPQSSSTLAGGTDTLVCAIAPEQPCSGRGLQSKLAHFGRTKILASSHACRSKDEKTALGPAAEKSTAHG